MNGILQTTLGVLVGVCLYAATYHLWIGLHRPRQRLHLLFAVLSFCVASHVLVKLGSYRAETVVQLVSLRRWEVTLGLVGIGMLPWFALAYTGLRWRALPAMLTLLLAIFLGANLVLPYGISFIELPSLEHLTLPWGEQVVDLRVHQRSALFNAGWLAMVANFVFAGYVCVHQYRHGQRRPAVRLALALGVFLAFLLFNQAVNVGLVRFTHTAEFGFVALVLLMSAALSRELRASRDALAASETRFRALVEQSPFSIQVLAPDGRTLQVNRAWETLWGSRLEALSGYNVLRDRQLIEKGVMPYLERGFGGEATEIPAIVYNPAATAEVPGGSFRDRWVRAFVYPIKDSAGQIQEVILMHEDITDRKWSEDAIRHIAAGVSARTGEEFFQHLVQHLAALFDADYAFVGLLDTARRGTVTTLAVCAHGAIAPNMEYALAGTPCAQVVGQSTCAYPRGVQQQFPRDQLLADMGVDGYIGTPLFDALGKPAGLIVVLSRRPLEHVERVREILQIFAARAGAELQRIHAGKSLRASEQRLQHQQLALNRLAEAQVFAATDIERVMRVVTETVARTLGVARASVWRYDRNRAEIRCLDLFELAPELHSQGTVLCEQDFPAYFTALRENRVIVANDAHVAPETREFSQSYLTPLGIGAMLDAPVHRGGLAAGVLCGEHVGGTRDWTTDEMNFAAAVADFVSLCLELHQHRQTANELQRHREQLEERVRERTAELRDVNRELEAFSYSVSHDLRAPLRAVDGFAQALEEDYGRQLDETAHSYLARIRKATQRMGQLIDDLLELSRVGRAGLQPVEVYLSAVARNIMDRLAATEPARVAHIEIAPGISAYGDARLLHVVLSNLLDNAWKYTSKTAEAHIEFKQLEIDGQRVFMVRDNGAGFDMQYADKLFGAFQRLHGAEFPGTGIGLATVQRIIHRHGGRVWAEGRPGAGATFFFILPGERP